MDCPSSRILFILLLLIGKEGGSREASWRSGNEQLAEGRLHEEIAGMGQKRSIETGLYAGSGGCKGT